MNHLRKTIRTYGLDLTNMSFDDPILFQCKQGLKMLSRHTVQCDVFFLQNFIDVRYFASCNQKHCNRFSLHEEDGTESTRVSNRYQNNVGMTCQVCIFFYFYLCIYSLILFK